jgi:phage-related minor tail protein
MSATLTVGTLVAYLETKDAGAKAGLREFDKDMHTAGARAVSTMRAAAKDVAQAGDQAGRDFGRQLGQQATREVDQAGSKLGDAGKDAGRKAGKGIAEGAASEADSGHGKILSSFKSLAGKLAVGAAAAGAAAGAALIGGLHEAMGRNQATTKLSVGLLLTPEQAKQAGDAAAKVYADAWGDSFGDAANSVRDVISSFDWLRSQGSNVMADATESALAFAEAMEIDVTRGAQVAGQVVKSGLAPDVSGAFDLMLAASAKLPVDIREDLLDATEEYAQFFDALGFSGDAAFGVLVKGAEKGKYGIDKAGDAVKEFTVLATDMSTASVAAYKAIGLDAKKMSDQILAGGDTAKAAFDKIVKGLLGIKDPTDRANAAIALFGTPLEDLSTKDIPQFLQSLEDGQSSLGDFEGATKKAGDALGDNFDSKVTSIKRTLENKFINFLQDKAIPAVNDFARSLDLSAVEAQMRETVAKLRALWDDVVSDVREWSAEHKEEIKGFVDAAEGYFNEFMDTAQAAIDFIKAAWDAGGKDLVGIVIGFLTGVMNVVTGILQIIKGIFEVFTALLTGDWDKFWQGIKDIAEGQGNIIKGTLQMLVAALTPQFNLIRDVGRAAFIALTNTVLEAMGWIVHAAASAFGWVPGIGPQLRQAEDNFRIFRDRVNAYLSGIRSTIPINFTGSASGQASRIVLGGLQSYASGGAIAAGQLGQVTEDGPEMLAAGGRRYLLMGSQPGYVTPLQQAAIGGDGATSPTRGAGSPQVFTVVLDGSGWPDAIWRDLKERVQRRGGGNVQVAFTR